MDLGGIRCQLALQHTLEKKEYLLIGKPVFRPLGTISRIREIKNTMSYFTMEFQVLEKAGCKKNFKIYWMKNILK